MAACIHHEIDHLDGILIVDRIIVARMNRFTLQ
jgi:peptide deformylase